MGAEQNRKQNSAEEEAQKQAERGQKEVLAAAD